MNTPTRAVTPDPVEYSDRDGEPMSYGTKQFRWITTIVGELQVLFRERSDVFVAGDLLWYPVEGSNTIRTAPDAMVAFGRPTGHRGSYMQWREDGIAPQVVFETVTPSNRFSELTRKFRFYERYGVEEYYLYDTDLIELTGWQRTSEGLDEVPTINGWVSPRLGVRFEVSATELQIVRPDGRPFLPFAEFDRWAQRLEHTNDEARRDYEDARREHEDARRARSYEAGRVQRLSAQLRAAGIEPPP